MTPLHIVEPFAGLGAYSLYALARHASQVDNRRYRDKPPYSRMGSKAGFAPAVLRAWGLSRRPLGSVWLNDTCAVCQALWLSYASADFRDAVAARISAMVPCRVCLPDVVEAAMRGEMSPTPETVTGREWCAECAGTGVRDARLWWEECRAAPVPEFGVGMGAVGAFLQARSFSNKALGSTVGCWSEHGFCPEVREQAAWGTIVATPRHELASRFASLPPGVADFAAVGAWLAGNAYRAGFPEAGIYVNAANSNDPADYERTARWQMAHRFSTLPGPHDIPITMTGADAATVLPAGDASDCLVVLDPPYEATTGYANDSPRHAVITIARAWHNAGALVIIHEAAPLAAELGKPWESRPAGPLRGKASNFWKGGEEREWVTYNRAPPHWPAEQMTLFSAPRSA